MRIASIFQAGGPVVGIQLGEQWINFSAALQTYQLVTTHVQEPLITTTYELLQRGLFTASSFQEVADFVDRHALADAFQIKDPVKLLAPLGPGNFIGIGHQYPPKPRPRTPGVFAKLSSSIIGPEDKIRVIKGTVEYLPEIELAVVIGKTGKNLDEEQAKDLIAGYTIVNDVSLYGVTAPDGEPANIQGTAMAKGGDTQGPCGPWIVTPDEIGPEPVHLEMEMKVNGAVVQTGNTGDMLWKIPESIAFISQYITWEPGDLLTTGMGPVEPNFERILRPGDVVEGWIENIGNIRNVAVDADDL